MGADSSPLQQLQQAIDAASASYIQVSFDLSDGRSVQFVVGYQPGNQIRQGCTVRVTRPGKTLSEQSHKPPDVASAFKLVSSKYPDAVLQTSTICARMSKGPLTTNKMSLVVEQAWAESFGRTIPTAADRKRRNQEALDLEQAKVNDLAALLATGRPGIVQYNELSIWDRVTRSLVGARLVGLNLDQIQFGGANLKSVDLSGSSLKQAAFGENGVTSGNLVEARLIDSNLTEANLHNIRATDSDFTRANLSRAVGSHGTFAKCRLVDARLDHADFRHAGLQGADLTGASIVGTVFDEAIFDAQTRWPQGFLPPMNLTFQGKGIDPRLLPTQADKQRTRPDDFPGFLDRLKTVSDASKLDKALAMLKADRFRLFARVEADHLMGIVKSQSDASLIYACRLGSDGSYSCCTQNLNICGGLRGSPCKHLLVLILGLAQAGELDLALAHDWTLSTRGQKANLDADATTETLLQYKGAEAGEVDWRPTETIPEDFYAI